MKLKRDLGLLNLFCIASGAMISSGLFVLPGLAYYKIGPAVFIAYFIAALMVLPAMLSKAELGTAMPKAGGTYFFIDRSMGAGFGTLAGLSAWFSESFKSAFALLGIGVFATLLNPSLNSWQIKGMSVGCCVLFAVINYLGIGHTGKLQVAFVFGLLTILVFYVVRGLPFVKLEHFRLFVRGTPRELFATAGLIFVSYGGLTKIASVTEEVKNPARNIPLGMLMAFVVVSTLYVTVVFVAVGVLGDGLIEAGHPSLTPISDGAQVFMGRWGQMLLAFGAVLAFVSTGNAGIMAASHDPVAMSRDGLLPKFFQRIHPRFHTPYHAILFTTVFMMLIILFLDLEMLVKTASTIKILLFGAMNIAVIIMRESGIQNYQPKFRAPLYPWLQVAGLIGYGFLLFEMGTVPLTIAGFFLGASLLWYWLYGRIHVVRESALVHLVRRIMPRELTSYSLSDELREILLVDRDEVVADRFEMLVQNARVIDFEQSRPVEEIFKTLADALSERGELPADQLYELLMEREQDSSTVIAPGLAIPHIILPGEKKFEMMLARSRPGIQFFPGSEPVHAMFVLAGTYDERNFHLKALMSIAKIVQKPDFMKKWLNAPNEEGLRDIILLG